MTRCPNCGHKVESFFDHVHIDCEHDMTEQEIARLIQDAEIAALAEVQPAPTDREEFNILENTRDV
jgi:hypothetical protein